MFVPTFFLMDHNPHAQEIETVQVNQTVMLRPLLFGQGLVPWYHLLFCWGGGGGGGHKADILLVLARNVCIINSL